MPLLAAGTELPRALEKSDQEAMIDDSTYNLVKYPFSIV